MRTAARPIPIDRTSLEKALESLYHQAEILLKEAPEGVPIQESYKRLGQRRMDVRTVWGEERELSIYLDVEKKPPRKDYQEAHFGPHSSLVPITGGKFKTRPGAYGNSHTLEIYVNGAVYPEEILSFSNWALSKDRIKSILLHELTHAMDYLKSKSPYVTHEEDYSAYVNQPVEIRAHLQEIVEDAKRSGKAKSSPRFRKMFDIRTRQDQVKAILKGNTVWNRIERHLTPRNRKFLLKAVYRALEPFLEDLPVGRVPSARRVLSRYLKARKDQELLQRAEDIRRDVLQTLKRRPNLFVQQRNGSIVFSGEQIDHPDLMFLFSPKSSKVFLTKYHGADLIHVGLQGLGRVRYEGMPVPSIEEALEKHKRLIIHELTHYVDKHRMGEGWGEASKSYVGPDKDMVKYVNHPLELNAYFMQALSEATREYEKAMKGDPDGDTFMSGFMLEDWLDGYGKWKTLHDLFWAYLSNQKAHLTEESKRRFNKRLYDWWSKAVRRVKDRIRELESEGMAKASSYRPLKLEQWYSENGQDGGWDADLVADLAVAEFNEGYSHFVVDDHCYLLLNGGTKSPWLFQEALDILRQLPEVPDDAVPLKQRIASAFGVPLHKVSAYYSIRSGTPIRDVIERWVEHGDKVDESSMPHYVPARELLPYREYVWTRDKARDGNARVDGKRVWLPGPLKWDAMAEDLKKRGWDPKEPLHLQIGRNGTTKVGEGNHRLAIALEVGLRKVPVTFHFRQKVRKSQQEPEPVPDLPSRTLEKARKDPPPQDEKSQKMVDDIMKLMGF